MPVFCLAPASGIGASAMLFSLANYAPSPTEIETKETKGLEGTVMFVFKTVADPYVGRVSYFRMMNGSLHSGDTRLVVARTNSEERIATIYVARGSEQIPAGQLNCGDIGIATKPDQEPLLKFPPNLEERCCVQRDEPAEEPEKHSADDMRKILRVV